MYKQREIPAMFINNAEQICLINSLIFSKIRSKEITENLELFSSSQIMVRAYQKLFPAFEVCDGGVSRFCEPNKKNEYGEIGFFHYREHKSRAALSGQLKLIPHSLLILKESSEKDLPKLAVDVLPLGHIKNWPLAAPICLDEHGIPFYKKPLLSFEEKDFVRNVRLVLDVVKDLKEEVHSLL